MDYYDDDDSCVGDRISEAAEEAYANNANANYNDLVTRLWDHPELNRGVKNLSALELFLASGLDDETLVRVITEGMAYDKRHLELSEAWSVFHCAKEMAICEFENEEVERRKAFDALNDKSHEAFIKCMDEGDEKREELNKKIKALSIPYYELKNKVATLDSIS